MLRKVYYSLNPLQRRLARRLIFFPVDIIDKLSGRRPALVPPKGLIFTGRSFIEIGDSFLNKFIDMAGLKPDSRVLDIGCGIGRMARPLTSFLKDQGSYEGFDIVPEGIEWCKKAYKDFPNFSFRYIPLKNDLYNLSVQQEARGFNFPYDDNQFDLVILISVFTHMQLPDVDHYLKEICRVLKKNGKCLSTFFIITPISEDFLDKSQDPFFPYRYEKYFLHDQKVKDANIAFKYPVIEQMAEQAGLGISSFTPGWWAGEKNKFNDFQDILIFQK
jgi:ubiquinone/menaquinone biosynthesis C-methylase UbiE